jgi:hypothetical protein
MIQDLDKTLEKILYERGRLSRNDIDVSFEQPNGDWSARLARPTLNVWAFDLRENVKMRNMEFEVTRANGVGTRKRIPLRFDLTFLVTAWARKVEDEHQLLWRGLSALAQLTVLKPSDGEGAMRDQLYDIPILVGNIGDRLPQTSDLWSVLNNQMKLGFTFVTTLALDPNQAFEAPLVIERIARIGQSLDPRTGRIDALDVETRYRGRPEDAPPGALPEPDADEDGASGGSKKKRR